MAVPLKNDNAALSSTLFGQFHDICLLSRVTLLHVDHLGLATDVSPTCSTAIEFIEFISPRMHMANESLGWLRIPTLGLSS